MSEVTTFDMVRTVKVSDEDIDDIMDTAMMGIMYWCKKAEVVDDKWYGAGWASGVISKGGSIRFYDRESSDTWTMDKSMFIQGLKKAMELGYQISLYNDEVDPGDIDANMADVIVQCALFGEVIFG